MDVFSTRIGHSTSIWVCDLYGRLRSYGPLYTSSLFTNDNQNNTSYQRRYRLFMLLLVQPMGKNEWVIQIEFFL